ncbi:MAG: serine hydrolase domain-containing protein [Chromatiales bacterium]
MVFNRTVAAVCVALALRVTSAAGVADRGVDPVAPAELYFPPPGDAWERRQPEQVGMDPAPLERAIVYARQYESDAPRDFSNQVAAFGRQLGALPKLRAASNGILLRHGYIVAEWGDTTRPDPIYSVAKSFLSTLCGVAIDRRLIRSVRDRVADYVRDGGYHSPHNTRITWEQHLQQTSEWEGSLWGKSHDFLGTEEYGAAARLPRTLLTPGAYWEYNDVRVNRLALSLLRVWRKPLPQVLREFIMNPIGALQSWDYLAYDNAHVEIDGQRMPSISGGTRWGGGLWIGTRDAARFGYLILRQGKWGDRRILSPDWIRAATTPSAIRPDYGYMWWLNTDRVLWPSATASSFAALGYGSNMIWIDPEHDLVLVWRWFRDEGVDAVLEGILDSIR